MSKRRRPVEDEGPNKGREGSSRDLSQREGYYREELPDVPGYQGINHLVREVVRLVLGRDLRGQLIRREHIVQAIPKTDIPIDLVLQASKNVLRDVYGVSLVETPPTKVEERKPRSKIAKVKQPMVLVNCLEKESRQVLGELWLKSRHFEVPNNRSSGESQYLIPKYEKTDTPMANHELIKTGIMVMIVSLLILSENRLPETELIRYMKQFGISDNLNIRNSNYNLNLTELVGDLVKREYLNKEVTKGRIESETFTEYTLGRRSLVEFSPQSVFDYIKTIYGEKFDASAAERCLVTIEGTYGVSLDPADSLTDATK